MVDERYHARSVVDILGSKLDLLVASIHSGAPMAREAMTDLLKFVFNLLLHYPKVCIIFSFGVIFLNSVQVGGI